MSASPPAVAVVLHAVSGDNASPPHRPSRHVHLRPSPAARLSPSWLRRFRALHGARVPTLPVAVSSYAVVLPQSTPPTS
ncbi:hypothetical protein PF010_g25903 [Phytophthora fragariae]|uniref:Uncharacterized protein n=1 Tax=Phytophthora fragariae TaxID=53985 RepID=A0A6G0QGM9_9STRA|nr:hypothetical protein PF010_g25903 [Phytophthora fragariae]KAE9167690.1 hypothetical protein PF004_g28738 [Phytophthora fragariae]KAE9285953.1 hypothetical protein PF008_g26784 [Phytophthora fragariae]